MQCMEIIAIIKNIPFIGMFHEWLYKKILKKNTEFIYYLFFYIILFILKF